MTKLEMALLPRYEAALALHGITGVSTDAVAVLCLRAASAAAYRVVAGSQRKSQAWKAEQLAGAHNAAIQQLRDMARR